MSILSLPPEILEMILDQFDNIIVPSPCIIDRIRKWKNVQLVSKYLCTVVQGRIYQSLILDLSSGMGCRFCGLYHDVLLERFVDQLLRFPHMILYIRNLSLRHRPPMAEQIIETFLPLKNPVEKITAILKSAKLESFSLLYLEFPRRSSSAFDYIMNGSLAGKGLQDLSCLSMIKSLHIPLNESTLDGLLTTFLDPSLWPTLECLTLDRDVFWNIRLYPDKQRYICKALASLSSLQELNLRDILLRSYPQQLSRLSVMDQFSGRRIASSGHWKAIIDLANLSSVEIDSQLWGGMTISEPVLWQIQCTRISNLKFHIDGWETYGGQFGVNMLNNFLSCCSQLRTIKVIGQFWRSNMLWPSSILELDLDIRDEEDPPMLDERRKTMENLSRLPCLRVLHLPRTILAESYHHLISTLDKQITELKADNPRLLRVHIYPDQYVDQVIDGDEEELLGLDSFIKKLNSKIFQCGIVKFEEEEEEIVVMCSK